jgi:adenylate cyclase
LIQGIADDVTTDLSRLSGFFVVGHADGLVQKDDLVGLIKVARELNVCYVIQGSMRKVGSHVAVNVHLVSAETGAHIWAERFDVDLQDMVEAHDELTGRLVRSFAVKLIDDVGRRIATIDPQDWTSDDLVMRGRGSLNRPPSPANRREALEYFERAFQMNPGSVGAKYGIASVLTSNVLDGWSLAIEQDKAQAEQLLTEILRDDANNADARANMGALRRVQGRLSDAKVELEIALALSPNNIQVIGQLVLSVLDLAVDLRIDGSVMTEMHRDRETKCREEVRGEAQR